MRKRVLSYMELQQTKCARARTHDVVKTALASIDQTWSFENKEQRADFFEEKQCIETCLILLEMGYDPAAELKKLRSGKVVK